MPLNMAKAMADCLYQAAAWLLEEARLHETGQVVRVRDGRDDSKEHAEDLIHRARNMEAAAQAFERIVGQSDRSH